MSQKPILILIAALMAGSLSLSIKASNAQLSIKNTCFSLIPRPDSVAKAEHTMDKVMDVVAAQDVVKEKSKLIDSLSRHERHITLIPSIADSAKNIYLVKVCEDNGMSFVTYYNFLVDANTMTIIEGQDEVQE